MALKLEVFMATALSVWSKTTYRNVCHKIGEKSRILMSFGKYSQEISIKKTKLGVIWSAPEQMGLKEILDMHITIFTWW